MDDASKAFRAYRRFQLCRIGHCPSSWGHFHFISHTQTACVKLNIAMKISHSSALLGFEAEIQNKSQNAVNNICYIVNDLMICDNVRAVHSLPFEFMPVASFFFIRIFMSCFPALSMHRSIYELINWMPIKDIFDMLRWYFPMPVCLSLSLSFPQSPWMCVVETDKIIIVGKKKLWRLITQRLIMGRM